MAKPLPSKEFLAKTFSYNDQTGVLYWRSRDDVPAKWNGRYAGKIAGTKKRGCVSVILTGMGQFKAHRLIWKLFYGEDPAAEIDHADGNPLNNKIDNLRLASRVENMRNVRGRAISGFKGVCIHRQSGLWRARISVGGKEICRYFETADLAFKGYCDLAKTNFREFARLA